MGQKLIDKGTHWEVKEDSTAQLIQGLAILLQGLSGDQGLIGKKKKDIRDLEDEQSRLKVELAKIAETQPEEATRLAASLDKVLSPTRAESAQHDGEGPLIKWLHRKKHQDLKAKERDFKPQTYTPTPQLLEARRKAHFEAEKAETESILSQAKATSVLGGLKSEDPDEQILSRMLRDGVTVNAENYAMYRSKGRSAMVKDPYSPEWIAEKTASSANTLFGEFPDADPGDLQKFARAQFDPNYVLPEDVKKRLGKSATARRINLDERGMNLRAGELKLNQDEAKTRRQVEIGKLAEYLVTNQAATPDNAMEQATKFMTTGKMDVPMPKNLATEATRLKTEAEKADMDYKLTQARLTSKKFDQLLELAGKEPDEERKQGFVNQAFEEFKRIHGIQAKPNEDLPWIPWFLEGIAKSSPVQGLAKWQLGNTVMMVEAGKDAYVATREGVKGAVRTAIDAGSTEHNPAVTSHTEGEHWINQTLGQSTLGQVNKLIETWSR
jgi:hypothetical protein